MNRRRNQSRTPFSVLLSLFLAAGIATVGGVGHAFYKNQQIQVSREIDAIEQRVEQYRLDIRTTEMRVDQLLNRFVIRKQMEINGSMLRSIPIGVVEKIDGELTNRHSVASTTP
jgi:Ni,Fe-hydrogenase III large subunit